MPTSPSPPLSRYQVSWSNVDRTTLQLEWMALESRADTTFFTTWCWTDSWLRTFQPAARVARIQYDGLLVGLGLFTCLPEVRHGWLRSRVLRLARTGQPRQDQIWIEYNNLLLDRQHVENATAAFNAFLLQQSDWDELEIGAATPQVIANFSHPTLQPVERWSAPTFGVDLTALRRNGKQYLDSLSRNARYQINRSAKRYREQGPLTLRCFNGESDILQHWQALGSLHRQRWGNQPEQSGFANPDFEAFHLDLLATAAPSGCVELCTLSAGDRLLGCLYNFIHQNRVYFYLSGIQQESDAHLKPGLLIHALAIQHYLDRGLEYYDFMGGEARYKRTLATEAGTLQMVSFQRPRLRLKIEQLARQVKQWQQNRQAGHDADD